MKENEIHIIAHSLGVNIYHAQNSRKLKDKVLPKDFYRNYYCAGSGNIDKMEELVNLEKAGFMERWEWSGQIYFGVTENGKKKFRKIFKKII
jgi:ribosomal protein S19E (S16A)